MKNISDFSSSTATLARAAALAVLLVFVAAVSAEASTITCGFSVSSTPSCGAVGAGAVGIGGPGVNRATYNFENFSYGFAITFDNIFGAFDVTVENVVRTQAELGPRFAPNFTGSRCVPIQGLTDCIEFVFTAPQSSPSTWGPKYQLDFYWLADTENGGFSNFPGNRIRALHAPGASTIFTVDNTIDGSYFGPETCIDCIDILEDPGVSSLEDAFSSLTIAQRAIPEPASLTLLGGGLALLARRLRAGASRRR